MPEFTLQFVEAEIPAIAGRYSYQDDEKVVGIGGAVRQAARALTVDELVEIVDWKTSGRQVHNAVRNSPERVEEITSVALTVVDEELRIGALRCLHGVGWPVASAILHLCHSDRYPILDFGGHTLSIAGRWLTESTWTCEPWTARSGSGARSRTMLRDQGCLGARPRLGGVGCALLSRTSVVGGSGPMPPLRPAQRSRRERLE